MLKSDHLHYVDLDGDLKDCERILVEYVRRSYVKYRCRLCQNVFDLPIKVKYDTDINKL
jgi:phage FluMu protein Com